jgi:hypothetical protein
MAKRRWVKESSSSKTRYLKGLEVVITTEYGMKGQPWDCDDREG